MQKVLIIADAHWHQFKVLRSKSKQKTGGLVKFLKLKIAMLTVNVKR